MFLECFVKFVEFSSIVFKKTICKLFSCSDTSLSLSLSLSRELSGSLFSAYFFKFTHLLQTSSKLLTSSDSLA
ncbi:unnamed protein product, partial [Sphagnum jensenii]